MLPDNFRLLFAKFKKGEVIKNAQVLFSSFFLRLIFQSIYFVVLARVFGPDKYGEIIAVTAAISLFIPFANLGSGKVLIQNVSRDQSLFSEYYGTSILKTLVIGAVFISIFLILSVLYPIPNISIYSIFFFCLSNLIFMPLSDNCRDAFISVGLLKYTSKIILFLSANRFFGALALIAFDRKPTLLTWAIIYCIATLLTAIISSIMVFKLIGRPKFKFLSIFSALKIGASFSISDAAENIYNDLDKTMLSKLSTIESVAVYGAAYHILNVSLLPVQALTLATFKDFFQAGAFGIKNSLDFCKKILPISFSYSILITFLLFIFSPIIPKILGDGYIDSVLALMWLSPTIIFKSLHRLAADTLTGANYQRVRSAAQVLVAFLNGVLNVILIPNYQWRGAIWATLISEFLLMILLWSAVYAYNRKSQSGVTSS
jgi:O-antigen/teichoic acid export membrane protein